MPCPPPLARDARIELTLALLRRRAIDDGFTVSADDRVSEANAARLLELHGDTLAQKRKEGCGPISYGIGLGRAKVSYRLVDIAVWIESRREKIEANPG
jgi:hypothetical protein